MKNRYYLLPVLTFLLLASFLSACGTKVATETATGIVWVDQNEDGTRDPGENGVPGVKVYAIRYDNDRVEIKRHETTTDADGIYELEIEVVFDNEWELLVSPVGGGTFTSQDVGDDGEVDSRVDSDVNGFGRAAHVSGWFVDAGLRPYGIVEARQTPTATREAAEPPAPETKETPTATPTPLPTWTPAPPSHEILGTVYLDKDRDSHYLDLSGDEVLNGIEVRLIDGQATTVLMSTTTNSIGEYRFEVRHDGPVRIRVINPTSSNYIFAPPSEGGTGILPVQVDAIGLSLETFELVDRDSHIVNAAFQEPQAAAGELEVGSVNITPGEPGVQDCAQGLPLPDHDSLATIGGIFFTPPPPGEPEDFTATVTTLGDVDGAGITACTSLDLLNYLQSMPDRLPEWFFSAAANVFSGGKCGDENITSVWSGTEWAQIDIADIGGNITREGDEVTFTYPAEHVAEATHLYAGGVDFGAGVCTQLGLDSDGVGHIPLHWNLEPWGQLAIGEDTLTFANVNFALPFDAGTCSAQANLRQIVEDSGSVLLEPTSATPALFNTSFVMTLQNSVGLPLTDGCDTIDLSGILFLND